VLRHVIPVDDEEHVVECGKIVHVDTRQMDVVEIWAMETGAVPRTFRVFGTGQPWPTEDGPWEPVGTALTPMGGALVWHLGEKVMF
jgi:hypothetical protein